MRRNGQKKKKPATKKTLNKKPKRGTRKSPVSLSSFGSVKKLRGKNVWQIRFRPGAKSADEIIDFLITKFPIAEVPHAFVKYTIYERYRNERQSITNLAIADDGAEVIEAISETLGKIFSKVTRDTPESVKKMLRLKDYISGITIDFDSAITQFKPFKE